jgi:glycosyltransferase involved in cell wall biosynthesis
MDFEFLTMARWIQRWLKDEFGKDSVYLPIGLDEKIIFPTEPILPKGENVRVLLEGNIGVPFKGMEDAFHAVEGLDCEVWCVSSNGKPKPEWKCDRFFERVPWDQMKHVYSSCDVLLKMSRVESFSMPPLEMMACGGTAVVGKVTGIDEYIVDHYNALVVAEGDVEGAHKALGTLIDDDELRSQLARNGKMTASQRKWEPTIDILEELFNK